MSFSDLFDSEFKSRNKGHFSAIVRVAIADGAMSKEEKDFLDKLAVRLEIIPSEYEEILENPKKYPINPPYLHVHRLERLYDLSRMVYADHVLGAKQKEILSKFTIENPTAIFVEIMKASNGAYTQEMAAELSWKLAYDIIEAQTIEYDKQNAINELQEERMKNGTKYSK